jgi:hypothetical protein
MIHSFSFLITALALFFTNKLQSQSYIGLNFDNYSGIQGITFNPASIADSPYRADINLLSGSIFGGSDYFSINVSDVLNSEGGFDFDSDVARSAKNDNTFFFNADILGPSFMFNLNNKSSIAFSTRVRAFLNINNISGELYESLSDGFDTFENFDFSMENFNGTIHAWAEIGVTYAGILKQSEKDLLKGGITLKYLQGAGSAFFNASTLSGQFDAASYTLSTQGNLNYGLSQGDFDSDDVNFSDLTGGFGMDIGFQYLWNDKSFQHNTSTFNFTPYKLKVGISATDIGFINYKNSEITDYDMNETVNADIFDSDTEQALEDFYTGVTRISNTKIKLPTALHLLIDYKIKQQLYASLSGSVSLISSESETANSIINTFTLSPRYETKWLSIQSPISLRQYGDFEWGFGLRFGPLIVGSGTILSNLISNSSQSTDVYLGLKVPLYRQVLK